MEAREIKRKLRSFCRRNRTALKYTQIGECSAEDISDLLIERLGVDELRRILADIEIISRRNGDTVKYFMLILKGIKAA
ncbi:hypothetical protein KH172YL63_38090 [Bacillus sp. KH172YL63]|nr:hypothetical protein KH172YL63_38090 [Bacillus sp. KH172YL63]